MKFYSKLLLFGEYSVVYGSDALSIPFRKFGGELDFDSSDNKTKSEKSNKQLKEFCRFLIRNRSKFSYLDLDSFENELNKGLYFNSSIPLNYGLGSSGALVAAVFYRYLLPGIKVENNLPVLKVMLQNLESWFHGKSSGIDPLVSYLNAPVLIKNGVPQIVQTSAPEEDDFKVFLIDSEKESSTGVQIKSFQQVLKNKMFYYLFLEKYIPYINSAIEFYLEKNQTNFESIIADISDFQYRYLKILFPSGFREIVKEGLDERLYFLKLCGSGGGGFILGFTQDIEKTQFLLNTNNIQLLEL